RLCALRDQRYRVRGSATRPSPTSVPARALAPVCICRSCVRSALPYSPILPDRRETGNYRYAPWPWRATRRSPPCLKAEALSRDFPVEVLQQHARAVRLDRGLAAKGDAQRLHPRVLAQAVVGSDPQEGEAAALAA